MHRKYNKFLIISFVLVFILGAYSYFYNSFVKEASSADSSLTSSLTTSAPTEATTISQKAAEDTAFLMNLRTLTNIKIDADIFKDKSFNLLVNNKPSLEQAPYGRENPFSPTDKPAVTNKATIFIITKAPSNVTNKSAVLNGTLENGATSNNIYFEYGTTQDLGKATPKTTASLVGSFASAIPNLTSKTTYFYRAAANVNGSMVFGDLISFNTN